MYTLRGCVQVHTALTKGTQAIIQLACSSCNLYQTASTNIATSFNMFCGDGIEALLDRLESSRTPFALKALLLDVRAVKV